MKTFTHKIVSLPLVVFALLALTPAVRSQNIPHGQQALTPLAQALNPDGTIKAGVTGSLDPAGYKMMTDANGEPKFVRTDDVGVLAAGDEKWDDRFVRYAAHGWSPLADGVGMGQDTGDIPVQAMAYADGILYVGGTFTNVGPWSIRHIAKWDGSTWSSLGGNWLYGDVYGIVVTVNGVYIGGGGGIRRWDDSTVSYFCEGEGRALAASGVDLYMGYWVTTGPGPTYFKKVTPDGLGRTLARVEEGFYDGWIQTVAADGTNIYIGGKFDKVYPGGGLYNEVAAHNIARWDGSTWHALGNGSFGEVNAIAIRDGDVYAGTITYDCDGAGVSRWDGSTWSTLGIFGSDNPSGFCGGVRAMTFVGGDLYVGGQFPYVEIGYSNLVVNDIAKWDGSAWSALTDGGVAGVGVVSPFRSKKVAALVANGTDLYVGGEFDTAGPIAASNVAKWDANPWSPDGKGVDGDILAVAVRGGTVLVGGSFTKVGSLSATNIASWSGSAWSKLGSGVDDVVRAIAVDGTNAYVGGDFHTAGGVAVNHIARHDTVNWYALGSGVNSTVRAVATRGYEVYAGGAFTAAGENSASRVAKWNGSTWSALDSGLSHAAPISPQCYAIAVSGKDVYVGGSFDHAGGVSVKEIAKWNGSSWSALVAGVEGGSVRAIAAHGSDIYVGGSFTNAGGVAAKNIARWDGSQWHAMGYADPLFKWRGVNNDVYGIAVNGTNVYVTGAFTRAGSAGFISTPYVACWDGLGWSALGSGLNTNGYAIAVAGTNVYVGGAFTTAGLKDSYHFGIWHGGMFTPPQIHGNPVVTATKATIRFVPSPNLLHQAQKRDDLSSGSWGALSNDVTGLGGIIEIEDTFPGTQQKRFYRIKTSY